MNLLYFREYQIVVREVTDEDDVTNQESRDPDVTDDFTYIAGRVPVGDVLDESVTFVVGRGNASNSVDGAENNPPLKEGVRYQIYIGSCSVISEEVRQNEGQACFPACLGL